MIYSGLDWSGSPGEEHGRTVTFAVVHFATEDLARLHRALDGVRDALTLSRSYVFKNNGSGPITRAAFFNAIRPLEFTAHVYVLDKGQWAATQIGRPTGPNCIRDGVVSLILACPNDVVARQVLYVDIDPGQRAELMQMRTAIRQALRETRPRRLGFSDVRGCEDHRTLGAIIQVADMIAGQVADHGGVAGPHLPALGGRIHLA